MLLETLLPLGKVDPGLRAPEVLLDLSSIGRNAKLLEEIGYDGMVVEETKDDPFVIMALAAAGDSQAEARDLGRHRLPAQPDRHGHERLDAAETVAWPLHLGPRHAGQGAYRAPLRPALVARRPVDPRIRQRRARRLGLLAERHDARRQGAALQHQPHGAAVQSGPDRASAHPDPACRGQSGDEPDRGRGGRRPAPPSRLHAVLHRRGHAAGGARRCRQVRPLARQVPGLHEAAGRHRRDRGRACEEDRRRARPHLLLCLDAAVSRRLCPPRPGRPRRRAEAPVACPALGGDAPVHHRRRPAYLRDRRHLRPDRPQAARPLRSVVTHCEFSIPVNGADDKDRLRDLAKTIQGQSLDRARKAIVGKD